MAYLLGRTVSPKPLRVVGCPRLMAGKKQAGTDATSILEAKLMRNYVVVILLASLGVGCSVAEVEPCAASKPFPCQHYHCLRALDLTPTKLASPLAVLPVVGPWR